MSRRTVMTLATGASFSLGAFLVARTAAAQTPELESPKAKSVVALAAIVYWNSTYLADAIDHMRTQGMVLPDNR
jgi:hypothetical protein